MFIKNWMKKDPISVSSDMLASEAVRVFKENNLRFLPVVDNGKLRGLLARRDLREAASCVTSMLDIHELNFFNKRLKVKDLMVRKPVTLGAYDTVETALIKGEKLGRSFFPIMDGEKLVGTISDIDIYNAFYEILGVDENLAGISLEIETNGDILNQILKEILSAGISIHRFFTMKEPEAGKKRLVLRLDPEHVERTANLIKKKGYKVVEAGRNDAI